MQSTRITFISSSVLLWVAAIIKARIEAGSALLGLHSVHRIFPLGVAVKER